ncbi:hypothetical protein AKJ16_DCAP09499 [Drosera capensis]
MSSPGRPDRFPPPLMRFLRSTTNTTTPRSRSRSRSRSRATPLFLRRKSAIQEPSSPKVTCIGQVRARRSKPKPTKPKPKSKIPRCDSGKETKCECVRRAALFCKPGPAKARFRKGRPGWRKWVLFFRCYSKENETNFGRNGSGRANRFGDLIDEKQRGIDFVSLDEKNMPTSPPSSEAPPKNALLLTRCRSAPHRNASLVAGIWVGETRESGENSGSIENKENKVPISGNEAIEGDHVSNSKIDRELGKIDGEVNGVDGSFEEKMGRKTESVVDLDRNLMLKRCKSEPRRGSGRFDLGKERRWDPKPKLYMDLDP